MLLQLQRHRWPKPVLLMALVLYLAITLPNLTLPGLQYDEAADAVPALEWLQNKPTSALSHVNFAGREWPLMMLHYIGPTSIYTSVAGLSLFGQTVQGLRLTQIALGVITLLLLWSLARMWFGPAVASVAVLLCALSPAFVWWSRAGIHFALPLLPLALGMLIGLTSWHRTRQSGWLVLAAFCFGLGLTTKLLFGWLVVPMGLAALIALRPSGVLRELRAISLPTAAVSIVAMVLGLAPFIIHNVPSLDSFRYVFANSGQSQLYGHNNLDIIKNTASQTLEFLRMVGGDTEHFDAPAAWPLGAVAVVVALGLALMALWRDRRNLKRWFLVWSIVAVLPLSTFSVTATGARHLFIILPLACVLMAVALADGVRWIGAQSPRTVSAIGIGVVGLLSLNQLAANVQTLAYFAQTGGTGLWSSVIYDVAHTLETTYANRSVIMLDWGFERNVAFATGLRLRGLERYEFTSGPSRSFDDMATVLARDSNNVYLAHAPQQTVFAGHIEALQRALAQRHEQLVAEQTFDDTRGPNAVLYTAQPIQRTTEISPALAGRNAVLDGHLVLLGGSVAYDPARREVAVQLQWQAQADGLPDDIVLLHIVNQNTGEVAQVADARPFYGSYPFSQWQKGEVVVDPHWVPLDPALPAGTYQVRVGTYDPNTNERRAIVDPQNDAAGNSLMLATFQIP